MRSKLREYRKGPVSFNQALIFTQLFIQCGACLPPYPIPLVGTLFRPPLMVVGCLQVEAEGDVATAFTLARILSNIPLSRGGPTSIVIFDIHALQVYTLNPG